jgi:hypothetical protein
VLDVSVGRDSEGSVKASRGLRESLVRGADLLSLALQSPRVLEKRRSGRELLTTKPVRDYVGAAACDLVAPATGFLELLRRHFGTP